ncbi:MAG: FkbM family methyltransferase [Aquabacterium sp.]|uniref:FkbM family methyltransferase n=1 Tax=Aquabacterium sp. TaxID=1872578 RepID=UPI0025B9B620|nr:FkbM family methyltransferase [Aquabacterium sp.]MBI5924998.1 FkbM family methyltransferase [Aquabacterium sp.]
MAELLVSAVGEAARVEAAQAFCRDFCGGDRSIKRFVFGRNVYASKVIAQLPIDGVVDDFCEDAQYLGLPVVRTADVPEGAMVLVLSGGRPLSVQDKLSSLPVRSLDYFAFARWSGLDLTGIVFNEGFAADFEAHRDRYEWIFARLKDEESRRVFSKLVSFRLKGDIELLRGFTHREHLQYFEDFLGLKPAGETFFDVGGFDGFTTQEFIKRCPDFNSVQLFEPEPANFAKCSQALKHLSKVAVHPFGLSSESQRLCFEPAGSGSVITQNGSVEIEVRRLDEMDLPAPTFLKMDIEGAEPFALAGAKETIARAHPVLAVAIYHYAGGHAPFWQIPEQVLAIRDDYDIYVRHYTESIYETVMFFVPR